MPIPTRQEIIVSDSLDERCSCDHFLGKSLDEAESLFRENSLAYQEDLMWMGPVAFRYYVTAAIRYMESDAATGDSDAVNCFAGTLEFRLKFEPDELSPAARQLASSCTHLLEHFDRFEVSSSYGDLRGRLLALRETFSRQVQADETSRS